MNGHRIQFVGNLGRDVSLRPAPVCDFSVAANRKHADGEETVWFQVTAWGQLAEQCAKNLKKGDKVFVEGYLSPDKETGSPKLWTERKTGLERANYDVIAEDVVFL